MARLRYENIFSYLLQKDSVLSFSPVWRWNLFPPVPVQSLTFVQTGSFWDKANVTEQKRNPEVKIIQMRCRRFTTLEYCAVKRLFIQLFFYGWLTTNVLTTAPYRSGGNMNEDTIKEIEVNCGFCHVCSGEKCFSKTFVILFL